MNFAQKAFTLLELMIIVVIVGIVAGFAIPNYTTSVDRSYRKNAENNLLVIHAAQHLFAARNDGIYTGAGGVALINLGLAINIIANGMTYNCAVNNAATPPTFTCTAARTTGAFTLRVREIPISSGVNPDCFAGTCP